MHKLSEDKVKTILSLIDSGHPLPQIHRITGVSVGALSNLRTEHRPDAPKSRGGRPKLLSDNDIRHARRLITSGAADTATQVTKILGDITNKPIHPQTTRNALKSTGLKAVHKKKVPALATRHVRGRMHFTESHRYWTLEDWKLVTWSDETKINRFGSDGLHWVWKNPGETLSSRLVDQTVKHGGGSLMVWGCMTWEYGVGNLVRIDGKMDAELYTQILDEDLRGSCEDWGVNLADIIFQQDNDPKHTSKRAKKWFEDNEVKLMPWPAQSPDMNPIEHLWNYLKRRLGEYENEPKSIEELWERIQAQWNKIPLDFVRTLIESMPSRVEALLKAKGKWTKY
jgi:hypothetical protein